MNGWACVSRMGGIGDNLIAASVLGPLKRMGYMVEVLTSPPNHVLFHHNPYVDKLSVKHEGDIPGDALEWQKWHATRAREYDIFVHLSHSCELRHALFPHSTQFWLRPEYRRKICAGSYLETVHDIAGVPHHFGPLFWTSDEEYVQAKQTKTKIGERCIGWALSGTRLDKIYPFAPIVIARIIKDIGIPVMMFGAGVKQFDMAKQIMEYVELHNGTHKGLHLCMTPETAEPGGEQYWPIRRSLSQMQACDLVVAPDTGLAWGVAFEEMPKIILVSHASAENITKHWTNTITLHGDPVRVPCWPCHRLHNSLDTCVPNKDNTGAACISDISVELMMAAVQSAFGDEEVKRQMFQTWSGNITNGVR